SFGRSGGRAVFTSACFSAARRSRARTLRRRGTGDIPTRNARRATCLCAAAGLAIDRRETHVGDLVDAPQLFHDPRADVGRPHLAIRAILQLRLDAIRDPFELLHAHRALLARAHQAANQLLPLERLGPAVLLDHAVLDLLDVLAAGVALAAIEALAAAADAVALLALARVDHLVAEMAAERTLHCSMAPA